MDDQADPVIHSFSTAYTPSTRKKLLGILDEVEEIYLSFLELISTMPGVTADSTVSAQLSTFNVAPMSVPANLDSVEFRDGFQRSVTELISLLTERQAEFAQLVTSAAQEAEIGTAAQNLVVESDKLKDQLMTLFSRLKDAEHILSNALHSAKQKTENIRSTEKATLNLDDIVRYAHRISVGFSAAAPTNWGLGDPRRPYPTDLEMRAGLLARMGDSLPPPTNTVLALPTEGLTTTTQKFLASNAGPYTMSPQPASQSSSSSPKTLVAANIQREAAANVEQDVETMSSDSSSSTSSEEE